MENGKSRSLQYGTSKNLLEEVNVTKMEESFLKVESSGSNYYVKIGYNDKHENLISLTAVDGARTWYGEVSKAELEDQAASAEKSFDEFLLETKCALLITNPSSTCKQFSNSVELENEHLKFTWKLVLDHGLKFQLGAATLLESREKDIKCFLDSIVCQFSSMKEEISKLSAAKENLLSEREKTLKKLEEYATLKDGLEKDLYGKFLAVLNEKKAKIRELKQTCEDLKLGQAASGETEEKVKPQATHESSEDEDDTDKEEEKRSTQSKTRANRREMPQIIGADQEDEEEVTVASKRKRAKRKKSTSRGTVLPRTVSLPRPLKKQQSGSISSPSPLDQSSENLDKLLDNL